MTNERKLELTLCGMLPYGLEIIIDNDSIKRKIYLIGETSLKAIPQKHGFKYASFDEIKPLLHSLDKLTEPILEGGLIPIQELEEIFVGFEFYTDDDELSFLYSKSDCRGEYSNTVDYKDVIDIHNKLLEWHFNIYDLPKEMYIEKSEL